MASVPWPAAAFVLMIAAGNCLHLSSLVPEEYGYIGHSSQAEVLASVVSKQESRLPASLPARSTGYTAFWDEAAVKQGADQRQRSADKQHETLMFTHEGHLYTKPLVLPASAKRNSEAAAPVSTSSVPKGMQRSLLQRGLESELNPTLACEGCPDTDTRVRVSDSTQHPWNAVGQLKSSLQGTIFGEESECSGTLIGESHVLTAGHCVVNTDNGAVITGFQFWPAVNQPNEPFPPINVSRSRVLSTFTKETSVSTVSLNYDFALLTLQDPAPAGTAELAIMAGTRPEHYNLTTAGYPGDKNEGTMWTVSCGTVDAVMEDCDDCDNIVQHDCLTSNGQSGSGMWSNDNQIIRAIVTGDRTLSNGTTLNVGIRLNDFVFNTISTWYNEDAALAQAPSSAAAPMPASVAAPVAAPMAASSAASSAALMAAPAPAPMAAPTPTKAPRGFMK